MIRLLIADDHSVVRAGLAQLAATFDDVEVVATAADGAEAVERCVETRPDVVREADTLRALGGSRHAPSLARNRQQLARAEWLPGKE